MTSELSYTSKLSEISNQHLAILCTPNGTSSNRLLSPIIENSIEIHSLSLSNDKICPDFIDKSLKIPSNEEKITIDRSTSAVVQRFSQYMTNLQKIRTYIGSIKDHVKELTRIFNQLEHDPNLIERFEPIPTRLIQNPC